MTGISNGLTLPNSIANGEVTDAPQVMANYNTLLGALNRALLDAGGGVGMNAFGSQIHNLTAGSVSTDAANTGQLSSYLALAGGALAGPVSGQTPATADNSTLLATTAFVKAQGETFNGGGIGFSTNTTLTVAQLGGWGGCNPPGLTITLPLLSATSAGQTFTLSGGAYGGALAGGGTDQIQNTVGLSAGTYTLAVGEIITVASDGPGGNWYIVSDSYAPVQQPQGSFAALKITTQGVSNFTSVITANAVALTNSAGFAFVAGNVNVSPAINASGANGRDTGSLAASTWYYVWIIYNPTTQTTAGLFSLSSTSPTLPSGYTFAARVGSVRTDGSGNKYLLQSLQYGRMAQWVLTAGSNMTALPSVITGAAGSPTVPTLVAESTSSVAPPTASAIGVIGYANAGGTVAEIIVAPNAYYGSVTSANPAPISLYFNYVVVNSGSQSAWFNLESANIWYASSAAAAGVNCLGWEDNL